jgi:hypothetical protein
MAQYDPQKIRGRRPVSEDEPAPVDALLAPASADVERPVGDADAPVASPTPTADPSEPPQPSLGAGTTSNRTSKVAVVIVASFVAALVLVWWWRRRRLGG